MLGLMARGRATQGVAERASCAAVSSAPPGCRHTSRRECDLDWCTFGLLPNVWKIKNYARKPEKVIEKQESFFAKPNFLCDGGGGTEGKDCNPK